MKSIFRCLTAFLVFALVAVLPAAAQRTQKVVSGRGVAVAGCSATSATLPCFQVTPTSPGANTATFINFEPDPSDPTVGILDGDFDLFKVSTAQSVTFSNGLVGSFMCGDGFSASDAGLFGFCTEIANDPEALDTDFVTSALDSISGHLTYSFHTSTGASIAPLPAEWVFFADRGVNSIVAGGGGTTPVPEPNAIALLAFGLFALVGFKLIRGHS
jgi:hypothetical protein